MKILYGLKLTRVRGMLYLHELKKPRNSLIVVNSTNCIKRALFCWNPFSHRFLKLVLYCTLHKQKFVN